MLNMWTTRFVTPTRYLFDSDSEVMTRTRTQRPDDSDSDLTTWTRTQHCPPLTKDNPPWLCPWDLMFGGRLFHNFGAIFSKALSPNVLDFTHISERRFFWLWTKIATRLIFLNKFTEISRGISIEAFKNKSENFKLNTKWKQNQDIRIRPLRGGGVAPQEIWIFEEPQKDFCDRWWKAVIFICFSAPPVKKSFPRAWWRYMFWSTVRPRLSGHIRTSTYPDKWFGRIWEICLNTASSVGLITFYSVSTHCYSIYNNLSFV